MSEQINSAQFALAIVRSRFLDAHAEVEEAVLTRLRRLKIETQPLLGQNVEALAKAKPAPQYSKAQKARVDGALAELRSLQEARNDIVHGQMKVAMIDDAAFACFINPQRVQPFGQRPTLVNEADLRGMARELERLAADISND